MWKKGYHLKNLPNYRTHKAERIVMRGPMDIFFGSQSQTQPQEVEPKPGAGHGAGGQDCDASSEAVTVVEGEGAAQDIVEEGIRAEDGGVTASGENEYIDEFDATFASVSGQNVDSQETVVGV